MSDDVREATGGVDLAERAGLRRAGAHVEGRLSLLLHLIRTYPLGAAGAVICLMFLCLAALAPFLPSLDPYSINARDSLATPSAQYPFGADAMGRDVLARLVYGAQVSVAVALGATSLGSILGVAVGLLSGYRGGWVDMVLQRLMDIMQALPLLIMAIVMAAAFGPSLLNTILAISIPLVPRIARVCRSSVLSLRELPFVEGARAIGKTETAIALGYVLPNALSPLIVIVTAQLGSVILIEASLSFLGIGVPEPHPSWGRMLAESSAEYFSSAPWLVLWPGAAISLLVFGANLFGDSVRDYLDPRQRT